MRDDRFSFALVALYHSHRTYLPELRIVTVWAALERLFGDSTVELRFRVSASIAAYLEPPGEGRFNLCRQLMKLYDYRSKAAHGQEIKENSAFESTMEIARRALVKMIEERHVPSTEELRRLLFGWIRWKHSGQQSSMENSRRGGQPSHPLVRKVGLP